MSVIRIVSVLSKNKTKNCTVVLFLSIKHNDGSVSIPPGHCLVTPIPLFRLNLHMK